MLEHSGEQFELEQTGDGFGSITAVGEAAVSLSSYRRSETLTLRIWNGYGPCRGSNNF